MISLEEELQQLKEEMERVKAKSNVSSSLPYTSIHMYSTCQYCIHLTTLLFYLCMCPFISTQFIHIYLLVCLHLPVHKSNCVRSIQLVCPCLPTLLPISTQPIQIYLLIHPYPHTVSDHIQPTFTSIYPNCPYLHTGISEFVHPYLPSTQPVCPNIYPLIHPYLLAHPCISAQPICPYLTCSSIQIDYLSVPI